MKKVRIFYQLIVSFLFVLSVTSCLNGNLEDLPAFEDADITDVKFDFRYKDLGDEWIDGEPIVKVINLVIKDKVIDLEAKTITCNLEVPVANESFTEPIRQSVSLSNVVGKFNLSTAAAIKPLDGAPVLGVPGDFSKSRKYLVTSASGIEKEWTIEVKSLIK